MEELEKENKDLQVQLKNLAVKNEELLLQNNRLSQEVEALKSERERLLEKQSDLSPTLLPSLSPEEFSKILFDWDENVMADDQLKPAYADAQRDQLGPLEFGEGVRMAMGFNL
jgi:chromosome segregation ATPase